MSRPIKYLSDTDVITQFVNYLRLNGHPGLVITRWPDQVNRRTKDIDAVADNFAIEHTSIDSLPEQRKRDYQFKKVLDDIEEEVAPLCSSRIEVTLPFSGIRKGQNWSEVRVAIKKWIVDKVIGLPLGHNELHKVPGVPFEIKVSAYSRKDPCLRFKRSIFGEKWFLSERLKLLVLKKAEKLVPYSEAGKVTVLLVEMGDVLSDEAHLWEAGRKAFPEGLPSSISELWYADTFIQDDLIFHKINTENW